MLPSMPHLQSCCRVPSARHNNRTHASTLATCMCDCIHQRQVNERPPATSTSSTCSPGHQCVAQCLCLVRLRGQVQAETLNPGIHVHPSQLPEGSITSWLSCLVRAAAASQLHHVHMTLCKALLHSDMLQLPSLPETMCTIHTQHALCARHSCLTTGAPTLTAPPVYSHQPPPAGLLLPYPSFQKCAA